MTEQSLFQDPPSQAKPDPFDAVFWPRWPHKVDKKNSRRAFRSAVHRASLDEIMAGVDWYVANKPNWQAWKSASAWLNGDRWNDGLEDPTRSAAEPDDDARYRAMAEVAKRPWGRHRYPRQDLEECVRRGHLTRQEMEDAL